MDIRKLVKMANQIADNFNAGDSDAAIAGTLDHITRFWTLEMKKQIIAHQRDGKSGLNEIAAAAVAELARNKSYAA